MHLTDAALLVTFDTEYVAATAFNTGENLPDNLLLSYQFAVRNPRTQATATGLEIIDNAAGLRRHKTRRHTFTGMLGRVLSAAENAGLVDTDDGLLHGSVKIAIAAHFSRADLAGFRDAKDLMQRFSGVRGTYCSIDRPMTRDVWVNGRRVKARFYLYDTRNVAPAGKSSLADLGDMLGEPKLTVPPVMNGAGETVPGITRMDLVLRDHPSKFLEYAIQDCIVAMRWIEVVSEFAAGWGLTLTPKTTASLGVRSLMAHTSIMDIADCMGRSVTLKGKLGDPHPMMDQIQAMCADAYKGGCNLSFANGLWRAGDGCAWGDVDQRGAYGTAQAFFRPIDPSNIFETRDLDDLATLERMTFARIRFDFSAAPKEVHFPTIAVDANMRINPETGRREFLNYGLVFPISGETVCTGPELVVARNLGCAIEVIAGVVIPWRDPDGVRPFVQFASLVNETRKRYGKGHIFEALAKEALNSLYGKIGQAVGGMKTLPRPRRVFNTMTGETEDLPPSEITCAPLAAYISAIPRAALCELIAHLPPDVSILSATTDGAVIEVPADILAGLPKSFGPGALYPELADLPANRMFSELRAMVDPDRDGSVLEIKHKAREILQIKTRGQFATGVVGDSAPILARAGHRLPAEMGIDSKRVKLGPSNEVAAFADMHRHRQYGEKIKDTRLIGLREQWKNGDDLISIDREISINLEFDFKRAPIEPQDCDGLIQFRTRPWRDRDEFVAERRLFDRWRASTKSCLRTLDDWLLYQEWRRDPGARKAAPAQRTPYQQALMVAGAKGLLPGVAMAGPGRSGGMTLGRWAELITTAGVLGATRSACLHARQREPDPVPGSIDLWTDRDAETAQKLIPDLPPEALAWPLFAPDNFLKRNELLQNHFLMSHENIATDNTLIINETEVIKNFPPVRNLNDPNRQGGIRDLGHLKMPAETASETPPLAGAMDLSDIRHRAAIRRRLQTDFGVARLHLDRASRKVPADLPGGAKAREIWIMAAALAARTGEAMVEAFAIIGRLAAETLEDA